MKATWSRILRWGIPGLVAFILVVGAFGLVALTPIAVRSLDDTGGNSGLLLADLQTGGENEALRGELVLKDPTPLFLPTPWNSGQVEEAMTAERSPGSSFGSIGAKLVFPAAANDLNLPDGVRVPATALAVVDQVEPLLKADELARRDTTVEGLPSRSGYLEVLAVDTGNLVYSRVLDAEMTPNPLRAPAEALLTINTGGLWLRPTVVETADGAAVDFEQINSVLQTARLDVILKPGFYRILLGP